MAFRWRAENGPTLNASLVALWFSLGIQTSIAKRPYIFVIFEGVSGPPAPHPPLNPPMLHMIGSEVVYQPLLGLGVVLASVKIGSVMYINFSHLLKNRRKQSFLVLWRKKSMKGSKYVPFLFHQPREGSLRQFNI